MISRIKNNLKNNNFTGISSKSTGMNIDFDIINLNFCLFFLY